MTMKAMTPYVDVLPDRTKDPTGNTMRIINYNAEQEDRFVKNFLVCLLDTPANREPDRSEERRVHG